MRTTSLFNSGWRFIKEDVGLESLSSAKFEAISLPHTWNAIDGQDGGNDYYRGRCWYTNEYITPELGTDRIYLEFEGANSIAEVYVNSVLATRHEGGFSRFRCDITSLLKPVGEKNDIVVSVDNGANDNVYPQFADFTFFGGIYRNVSIIRVNESHFDLDYLGAPGIAVNAKPEGEKAAVTVTVYLTNVKPSQTVRVAICGENAPEAVVQNVIDGEFRFEIADPHLWNGVKDPYCYTAVATLLEGEKELDKVETIFGVRSFSVDPEKGFILNGKEYPLRGVCRHQDRKDKGWAISKEDRDEDMALIKEVGANTIRLAHYQHDDYFYELCDRNGIAIWVEIPKISRYLSDGHANAISQMKELVCQNYNHPSIVCWGLSNEITIGGETEELIERHHELNDLCHTLDPDRPTTMAQVSMLPFESELNQISDILSYNIYYGWYGGEVADNGPWLDEFHAAHPTRPMGISEYGCEAVLSWHTDKPECGDYSEEYQAYYHEKMLETIMSRPYLWATHVWNMFDFASDMRNEGGVKGMNNKGLVTFDRQIKKDSFYIYKAWLSDEKFVHICGRRYYLRASKNIRIKVYSNCSEVELFVNGKSVGKKSGDKVFEFDAKLRFGKNKIKAVSGNCVEEIELKRVLKPSSEYVLKKSDNGVDNWFEDKIKYPEGYFTVKDKFGDIMANPEGMALIQGLMAQMSDSAGGMGGGTGSDDGLMKVLKNFTVERIMNMAGDKFPKEAYVELSNALNKIKKTK